MTLLTQHQPTGTKIMAGVEAATCLLHLGLTHDAYRFAQSMQRLAASSNSEHYRQAAINIEAMATFQRAGRNPGQRLPGLRAVRSLERRMDEFTLQHRSAALSFIGAWQGAYADHDLAMQTLYLARSEAERLDNEDGAYLAFLSEFRMAEISPSHERESLLQRAGLWIPRLQPRNRELAVDLTSRLRSGEDTSIRSTFHSSEVQSMLEERVQGPRIGWPE
jgi:hypothetical protein